MPLRLASHLGCSCSVRRGPAARHFCFIIVSSDIGIVAHYVRPPRSPRARQFREFSTTCLRRLKRRGPFPCGYNRKSASAYPLWRLFSPLHGNTKGGGFALEALPCFIRPSAATSGRCAPQCRQGGHGCRRVSQSPCRGSIHAGSLFVGMRLSPIRVGDRSVSVTRMKHNARSDDDR
jgi:hypothetical protein